MLIGRGLLLVSAFPTLQIPNLKAALPANESNFAFQSKLSAKIFRQYQAPLSVRACVLSARVQVAQKNPAIPGGNILIRFHNRTHFRKLPRRHNEEKLIRRLRQKNEFLRTVASPTRRNRDSILVIDGMPELSGIETFGLGISVHWSSGVIVHFAPLDTTLNHLLGPWSIKIFRLICTQSP
jgi:hypothetical protein